MAEPMTRRPSPKPRRYHVPAPPTAESPLGALVGAYLKARRRAGRLGEATIPAVRCELLRLAESVSDTAPDRICRQDVERFLDQPGLMASTRRKRLSMVRTLWRWLLAEGYATTDPTAGVDPIRVPRSLPRGLAADQVRALLEHVPDVRARLIVLLEVQEGLRSVEVARLRLEHIDFGERTVLIDAGKGGHQRLLPISDETWAALHDYLAGRRESGPLVRNRNSPDRGLAPTYVVHMLGLWMRAAGVPEGGHALRHTCASDLLRRGVHLRDIQATLGHSNLATTSRYLPTNVADLRQAMAGRRYAGPPAPEPAPTAPETALPALDALGPLIDTVAALAATVTRLEARLDGQALDLVAPASDDPRANVEFSAAMVRAASAYVWADWRPARLAARVAEVLGCSRQAAMDRYDGRVPYDDSQLAVLADTFGVPVTWFFEEQPDQGFTRENFRRLAG